MALRSPALRVRSLAAATIWMLACNSVTIERLPVARIVPALCQAITRHSERVRTMRERATTVSESDDDDADAADDEDAGEDGEDADGAPSAAPTQPSITSVLPIEFLTEHATSHEADLQSAHAVASIGYAALEQQLWQAGALLACLATDEGRRAFYKAGAAVQLLPLLEAPSDESPPPLKAACAAIISQAASAAPPVCKALLVGGAHAVRAHARPLRQLDACALPAHAQSVLCVCFAFAVAARSTRGRCH